MSRSNRLGGIDQVSAKMGRRNRVLAEALERRQMLSASGQVFNDLNTNGVLDSGETGIAGRTVFADLNGNGVLDNSEPNTLTAANGTYTLATTSTATLLTVLPAGWYATGTPTVEQGSSTTTINLGEAQGMIASGAVYVDANANGRRDTGETGLAGVAVYQDLNSNGVLDAGDPSSVTASDGSYSITIQPPSKYSPDIFFKPVAGYLAESGGIGFAFSAGSTISFSTGYANQSYVSGFVQKYLGNNGYTAFPGVTVYADLNNDGILDSGDISETSADSSFQFGGLPQGSVTVRVVVPNGYSVYNGTGATQITVGPLTASRVYFYLQQNSTAQTVSGTVYNDSNDNGTIDPGETGLPRATVYIDANADGVLDNGELSTTTDYNGNYLLSESVLGTYSVRVVVPSGDTQTLPAGGAAITASLLTPNQAVTGANFALAPISAGGTVSGEVFTDYYASGSAVPEYYFPGIGGITVYDDLNLNGQLDTGEPSTSTAASGSYTLNNLPAGTQSLRIVVPTGYTATDSGAGMQLVAAPAANVDFPLFQDMEFKGLVYADTNGNAKLDYNETGQAGVRVYIDTNRDGYYDTGDQSVLTDSSGLYDFQNIKPQSGYTSYQAYYVPPTGYISQFTSYGVGYFSGDVSLSRVAEDSQSFVRGYVNLSASASQIQSPGITVYADLNNDGVLDAGDLSTTTDSNGNFQVGNLPTGTDTIRVVLPAGDSIASGSDSQSVVVNPLSGRFIQFYLSTGSVTTGSISTTVYQDTNGNGVFDANERPIAGRTFYLDANNNGVLDAGETSAVSDSSGFVLFNGLAAGTYTEREALPAGVTQTYPSDNSGYTLTLTTYNGNVLGYQTVDFGNQIFGGSIAGNVFYDANGDGLQDNGEANVANPQVYIDANNNGVFDAGDILANVSSGTFSFTGLTPGNYVVRQILATGYQQSLPGGNGGISVNVVAGQTSTVTFGTDNPTPTAVISGPLAVTEGASINLGSTGSGEVGGVITKYEWDLNYNGTFFNVTATGAGTPFSAAALDGPSSRVVALRLTDAGGNTNIATATIQVSNVPPTGTFSGTTVTLGAPANVAFTNVTDPGTADTAAGFTYSYDFDNNGVYDLVTSSPTATVPASYLASVGTHTIAAEITDKDGGSTTYTAAVHVNSASDPKLTGIVIGTAGSYKNSGNTAARAFDGSLTTYFDGPNPSGDWVGLDLGSAKVITSLAYASRSGWASRMNGGIFQASNSSSFSSGVVNLYTVAANANPSSTVLTTQQISNSNGYRYVRYLGPANSYGDVSEVQFFGKAAVALTKFTGTTIGTSGSYQNSGNTIAKATDGNLSTFFDGPIANGNWVGLDLGSAKIVKQISFAPRTGWASRMIGGIFQASNSANFSSGVVNLYTVTTAPMQNVLTNVSISVAAGYRYVRYLSPNGSYGDVAEIAFYG